MMGVFDSIELRMQRRADYVPTPFPTQGCVLTAFRGCESVNLWGACAVSHSLLSLAFATRWNKKHTSYVSIRLLLKLQSIICNNVYVITFSTRTLFLFFSSYWTIIHIHNLYACVMYLIVSSNYQKSVMLQRHIQNSYVKGAFQSLIKHLRWSALQK